MKKEELPLELLVGAAKDLNKVLGLKPEIAVDFESTLKGAALKAAEKKFMEQLEKDLADSGALVAPTDTLESKTIDVLEALEVKDIRTKLASGGTAAPPEAQKPSEGKGVNNKMNNKMDKKTPKAIKGGKPVVPKVKKSVKATPKAPAKVVEKDSFGFRKGSKSSEAVGVMAAGKLLMKDIKKKFDMLSFGKLIADLEGRGFKVKEDKDGRPSVTGKLKS